MTATTTDPHADHDCFATRSLRARVRDWVRPVHAVQADGWSRYEIVVTRPARGRIGTAWAGVTGRTWAARLVLLADEAYPLMPARQDLGTVYARTRIDAVQAARHVAVDQEYRLRPICGGLISHTCPVTITVVDVDDFES